MIGAAPFENGLTQWLKRSPEFNMEKVTAALRVVALSPVSLPQMWEPYAAMRYLHKPVELILLYNNMHVLSNPSARLVSQGGSVDWLGSGCRTSKIQIRSKLASSSDGATFARWPLR
jgi:hypothetical protein